MSTKSRANKTAANKRVAAKVAEVVKTTKTKAQPHDCGCLSHIAYRVTATDIPEADADTFVEFDVFESCGGQTVREFLPGHDAKLKSHLISAHLAGRELSYLSIGGGTLNHESAMNMAKRRGWEKFLDAAMAKQDRKIAARTARALSTAAAKQERDAAKRAVAEAKLAEKAAKPAPTPKPAAAKTKTEQKAADATAKAETQKAVKGVHPVRVKIGRMVHDANVIAEGVNEVTVQYKRRQAGSLIDTTTVVKRAQLIND